MFGQLSNRESLRDLIVALEAHHFKAIYKSLFNKNAVTDSGDICVMYHCIILCVNIFLYLILKNQ